MLRLLGLTATPLPTRWSFTPSVWCSAVLPFTEENAARENAIGAGCTLFHNATEARVAWVQVPASQPDRASAFSLEINAEHFDGSYLSLAIAIPARYRRAIDRKSIISIAIQALGMPDLQASLRMNVKRGPNTYDNWHQINLNDQAQIIEFDMSNFGINPAGADNMWLDFMVTQTGTCQFAINTLSISHRLRLEF